MRRNPDAPSIASAFRWMSLNFFADLKVHDLVELVCYATHEQLVHDYAPEFCRTATIADGH
jgi:hypothetical protein